MIDMTKWVKIAAENVNKRDMAPGRLSGKIAIVTGSAQGFGKGIAEILYAEGASVVIADLNDVLASTVAEGLGERAYAVKVDVSDEESVAGGKFGGIGLVQSFAMELAPVNVKVNAICPGNYYDGPLWSDPERGLFVQYLNAGKVPGAKTIEDVKKFYLSKWLIQRGCLPSDVAKAIMYAVEQTFETGQAIPVTGGQNMLH